jgi:hypothetical protein
VIRVVLADFIDCAKKAKIRDSLYARDTTIEIAFACFQVVGEAVQGHPQLRIVFQGGTVHQIIEESLLAALSSGGRMGREELEAARCSASAAWRPRRIAQP